MHSCGFEDAPAESLTIEAPATRDVGPTPEGDHPDLYGGWAAGRRNDLLGLFGAPFLPPSRPRKSEDALQQTELLSVGTVCADVPAPMSKEISGHRIEEEQAPFHRHEKGDSNDNAG